MKKIIITLLVLTSILFMGSAYAINVSFTCNALGNVIHCDATTIDVTHVKWEWKHIEDTTFRSTGWIPVEWGANMDFINIYRGRHIIVLTGKNGSNTDSCQGGVTVYHGEKTEESLSTAPSAEETVDGKTMDKSFGEDAFDFFKKISYADLFLYFIIFGGALVFFMIIKKKKEK